MSYDDDIKLTDEGIPYKEYIALYVIHDEEDGDYTYRTYKADPQVVYAQVRGLMDKFLGVDQTGDPARVNLGRLLRTAVKGVLILYGSDILDGLYGSKDHPKPDKKQDLLAFYADQFTQVALAQLLRLEVVLDGKLEAFYPRAYKISRLSTRPYAAPESDPEQEHHSVRTAE